VLHQQHPAARRWHASRGFRGALTRQVNGYADVIAKKEKIVLTGDDCREGLTAVCR
jgi:DNA gyrase/topoisomerase IV subunit B